MPEPDAATRVSRNLLIVTNDAIGDRMAGPAIRSWELARVLSRHVRVDLAVPPFIEAAAPPRPDFAAEIHVCRRMKDLRRLAREADLLMTLGTVPLMCPFLMGTDKPLILDAYDPFLLAGLERDHDFSPMYLGSGDHIGHLHAVPK